MLGIMICGNSPDRLERKKYNPFLKRVTVHREIK